MVANNFMLMFAGMCPWYSAMREVCSATALLGVDWRLFRAFEHARAR
jgi:hypothetical protein